MSRELSPAFLAEITAIRHYLHANPELSNQEVATTAYINNYLAALDINCLPTSLSTGVIGEIGESGPIVALRADIDALPITEATELSYASTNPGVMHACGHDFHTAALLGAATLLKAQEGELNGRIRLIFQPAEEDNGGARRVIEDGHLEGVSAILGFHNKPELPVGTVGIKEGPLMAAVDRFKITIKGIGSHAAAPHNGSDPVITACQIVTALQGIVSRHVSPLDTAILSVTHITGGNTWNVIPETVFLEGTIRTFSQEVQEKVKRLTAQVVANLPVAFDQVGTLEWVESPPAVWNDAKLAALVSQVTSDFANVIVPEVTLGGEDFAYYQTKIPGFFAFIGTNGPHEWHHPAFEVDDRALGLAINYYVETGRRLLAEITG